MVNIYLNVVVMVKTKTQKKKNRKNTENITFV
jgi:hypothetical protein